MPLEISQVWFNQPKEETPKILRVIDESESVLLYSSSLDFDTLGHEEKDYDKLLFPLDDAATFDLEPITGYPERIHIWSDGVSTWFIRRASGDFIRILSDGVDLIDIASEPQCDGNWMSVRTELHIFGKPPYVVQFRRIPTEGELERQSINESDYF